MKRFTTNLTNYTALGTDQQVIDVYIEDSFGQVVQKTFSFQNANAPDEEEFTGGDENFGQ